MTHHAGGEALRINLTMVLQKLTGHDDETLNMKEQFELLYGYIHCRGKTTYRAGYVDTKEEACAWVRNHREGLSPKMKILPEDPVRYCRAAWCPFKMQKPWFDMVQY